MSTDRALLLIEDWYFEFELRGTSGIAFVCLLFNMLKFSHDDTLI